MSKEKWFERKKGAKIFNFKDNSVLFLEFLNDGEDVYDREITLKDGSKKVIEHTVEFDVINISTKEEGKFSATALDLMQAISSVRDKTMKGKKVRIEHRIGRTKFDNTYTVTLLKNE